jgi:hypothetical protein
MDNFVLNDHEIGISPGALDTHFEPAWRAAAACVYRDESLNYCLLDFRLAGGRTFQED